MAHVRWLGIATAVIALTLAAAVPRASAHEPVTVGPYGLLVGWRVEPPVAGLMNGLDLRVNYTSNGTAVEGVESGLRAVLSYASYSIPEVIGPNEDRGPGWYTFDVIPIRAGTYKVRIMGSLPGTPVDVNVTLDDVSPSSSIEFPVPDPTAADLQAEVGTATLVAAAGVVVGLAGLGTGVLAIRRSRPKP